MDPKVLTYKGVDLRMGDLDILRGPRYLTDSLIGFYFSYLTSHCDDDILLVCPNVTHFLALCQNPEDEFRAFAESEQLRKRKVVIFAVNDNKDLSGSDGGNHWSLLVYFRESNAVVHYDSLGGLNSLDARKMYTLVKKFVAASAGTNNSCSMEHKCCSDPSWPIIDYTKNVLGLWSYVVNYILSKYLRLFGFYDPSTSNHGDDEEINDEDDDEPWYREETAMPRQTNFYDCGLYVLAVARAVCEWYYNEKRAEQEQQHSGFFGYNRFPDIARHVDNSIEKTMRSELLWVIQHQIKLEEFGSMINQRRNQRQPGKENSTGTEASSLTKRKLTGTDASQHKKFKVSFVRSLCVMIMF